MKKLAVLAVLMAVGIASPVWAEKFGMVGIVAGQTARLNVVNTIGDPNTRPNCRVALGILDSQGNILVDDPDQIPGRGQATFLELNAAAFEARVQIRAIVVKSVIDPRQRNTCPKEKPPAQRKTDRRRMRIGALQNHRLCSRGLSVTLPTTSCGT